MIPPATVDCKPQFSSRGLTDPQADRGLSRYPLPAMFGWSGSLPSGVSSFRVNLSLCTARSRDTRGACLRAVVSNVGIVAKSQSACIGLSEQRSRAFGVCGRDKDLHRTQAVDREAMSLAQ